MRDQFIEFTVPAIFLSSCHYQFLSYYISICTCGFPAVVGSMPHVLTYA